MFKDKVFNVSFIISFCWHLVCIFVFILVVTPKGFSLNKFPATAFLGPILEGDSFNSDYSPKPIFMVTPYKEDFTFDQEVFLKRHDFLYSQAAPYGAFDKIKFGEPRLQKQVPDFLSSVVLETKKLHVADVQPITVNNFKGLKVRGDLASRHIMYRSPVSSLPEWINKNEQSFSIDLKISVSGDGLVRQVDRITTTGYAEIDLVAMKMARGLIFQPLEQVFSDRDQEGEITIVLDSK